LGGAGSIDRELLGEVRLLGYAGAEGGEATLEHRQVPRCLAGQLGEPERTEGLLQQRFGTGAGVPQYLPQRPRTLDVDSGVRHGPPPLRPPRDHDT
jgi:hypothetical protein